MYLDHNRLDCKPATPVVAFEPIKLGIDRLSTLYAVWSQPLPRGGPLMRALLAAIALAPARQNGACAYSPERLATQVGTRLDRLYGLLKDLHADGHIQIRRSNGRIRDIHIPVLPGEPRELWLRQAARKSKLCPEFAGMVQETVGYTNNGRDLRYTSDLVIQWAASLRAGRGMTRAELAWDLGLSERQCRALVPAETVTDRRGKHIGLRVRKDGLFTRGSYPAKTGVRPKIAPPVFAGPTRAHAFSDSITPADPRLRSCPEGRTAP